MSPGQSQLDNPDPGWIEVNVWGEIKALCGLDYFREFAAMFAQRTVAWRRWAVFSDTSRKPILPKTRAPCVFKSDDNRHVGGFAELNANHESKGHI